MLFACFRLFRKNIVFLVNTSQQRRNPYTHPNMGCTQASPVPAPAHYFTEFVKTKANGMVHSPLEAKAPEDSPNNSWEDSSSRRRNRPRSDRSSNRSFPSLRKVHLSRAKSWVKDDLGFKAHLAKVNDMSSLSARYEMGEILGEGITGQVRLVRNKVDASVCAMKSLNVARMDVAQLRELRSEIDLLKQLDHPNVVSLLEVFESRDNISLVMEHLCGGDLSSRRLTSEMDVASVIYQITEAVAHCHFMGVVHRDLKMENVMFASRDSDSLRLIDFGLATKYRGTVAWGKGKDKERVMLTACGTAYYMAPEMLDKSYTEKADVWAIGIIAYMLVTGRAPFDGGTEKVVFKKIRKGRIAYHAAHWNRLSPEALDFTKALLTTDSVFRPSAKHSLQLPWLANYEVKRRAKLLTGPSATLQKDVCESLMRFACYNPLKKAALMIVAHHVKEKELRELRDVFLALDDERSGELTFEEMFNYLRRFGGVPVNEATARDVFEKLDQSKTGVIHFMDFLAATIEARCEISIHLLHHAFDHLDVDCSGYISCESLQDLLGKRFSRIDAEKIIQSAMTERELEVSKLISRDVFIRIMTDDATDYDEVSRSKCASCKSPSMSRKLKCSASSATMSMNNNCASSSDDEDSTRTLRSGPTTATNTGDSMLTNFSVESPLVATTPDGHLSQDHTDECPRSVLRTMTPAGVILEGDETASVSSHELV